MAALLYELLTAQNHFAPRWERKQGPDLTLPTETCVVLRT